MQSLSKYFTFMVEVSDPPWVFCHNENHPISLCHSGYVALLCLLPTDAQAKQERTEHRRETHKIQMPVVEALSHIPFDPDAI